jgi:hypothetical protein
VETERTWKYSMDILSKKKKYSMDKIVYHAKPLETEQPDHVHGMKYSAACWCYRQNFLFSSPL